MRKSPKLKLKLHKSTLRALTPGQAGEVVGGRPLNATFMTCLQTCITTRNCE